VTQTTELVEALRDLDQAIDTAITAQNASVLQSVLADDFT
jgi:hypothetical protein